MTSEEASLLETAMWGGGFRCAVRSLAILFICVSVYSCIHLLVVVNCGFMSSDMPYALAVAVSLLFLLPVCLAQAAVLYIMACSVVPSVTAITWATQDKETSVYPHP
jgi:hypothetical protein